MRRLLFALLVLALGTTSSSQTSRRELENLAALARLYGVVRYFYPSDAAAALDWNRFAVHAVRQARAARNTDQLEAVLRSLFAPLGPGIEIAERLPAPPAAGTTDPTLIAWRYFGAGISDSGTASGPYKSKRNGRETRIPGVIDGFATQMQSLPAQNLRGRSIRLRGMVRADSRDGTGSAWLWLRVDRPNQQMGFFDNMGDRPVRDRTWREYTIEGMVADDATGVAFGAGAVGAVVAEFDDFTLESRGTDGVWTVVLIDDPGFEGSSSAGWTPAGTSKRAAASRPSGQAPEGKQFLRLAPPPDAVVSTELFSEGTPRAGAHVDVDLGSGLHARVPLALSSARARTNSANSALQALDASLATPADVIATDLDTRLADIVVSWNVFRHFYPYWVEAGVDWDARLAPHLEAAYAIRTREQHQAALRRLVADARDGHGGVIDTRHRTQRATLPIQLAVVENRIVITASDTQAAAPVGAVVTHVDGEAADKRLADLQALASGTPQWKQARAVNEMVSCALGARVAVALDTGAGPRTATFTCDAKAQPLEKRPAPVSELASGVWYVDLTRARMPQIAPELGKLASAKGVLFDVRGYPTDAGAGILRHLVSAAEQDRWMHVSKIVGPYGESAGWESFGWNVQPQSPRIRGHVVFLTDARAISYAESVLGYVADRKLGTIVGSPTAGTNGNVAAFLVPGGFSVTFTGMRVTRHDGTTPHHLAGIKPDVPVEPTVGGIRAGRDELIERALEVIQGK